MVSELCCNVGKAARYNPFAFSKQRINPFFFYLKFEKLNKSEVNPNSSRAVNKSYL